MKDELIITVGVFFALKAADIKLPKGIVDIEKLSGAIFEALLVEDEAV